MRLRQSVRARRHSLAALAIAIAGSLLPYLPNFGFGAIPYEDDLINYFWPVMHHAAESLRAGRLPLWTQNLYTGFPLFADPEAGTLFPLNWLLVLWDEPLGLLLLLCLSTALTALCMYTYACHLGLGYTASIIAAWVFALGGFATGHLVHLSVDHSIITLPLVLLAIDRALLAEGRRHSAWLLVASVAHALQWLGGHVQPPLMTWLLGGAYLVFRLFVQPLRGTPARTWLHRTVLLIAIPLVVASSALALAAAQLAPTFELAQHSARMANDDYRFATSYSFPPLNLVTLIWPYFFQDQSGVRWGLWSNWETAAYVGILPLLLAMVGVVFQRTRTSVFFALVALISLWLAMADYAPLNLHGWLYALPLLNVLRAPARFALLFDFALAVLAALGAQRWLALGNLKNTKPEGGTKRTQSLCLGGAWRLRGEYVAMATLASVLLLLSADFIVAGWIGANREAAIRLLEEHYRALPNAGLLPSATRLFDFLQWAVWLGNPQFALAAALLVSSAVWLLLTCANRLSAQTARIGALALILVDLSLFAAAFWQTAPLQTLATPDATTRALQTRGDEARVWAWPQSSAESNRLLRWDVPDANGYSALEFKRQAQLGDAILAQNNRLLDMMHVGWLVLPSARATAATPFRYDPRAPLLKLTLSGPPRPQRRFIRPTATPTRTLRIVSALEHAPDVAQGARVAQVIIHDAHGEAIAIPIRAGVETAEWALERSDVKAIAQHQAAPIAYTFPASDDFSHSYVRHLYQAELVLNQAQLPVELQAIEFEVTRPGVTWLVYQVALLDGEREERVARFELANFALVSATSEARLYRNRSVLPRAWLVRRAVVEPSGWKLLRRMTQPQFDPEAEVLLEEMPDADARSLLVDESGAQARGLATLVEASDERVRVQVQADEDAFLLLADTWYEGWQARDNGEPTTIYRANYLYRAVFVRAGQHALEFTFEPLSVRVGFLISAASWLCLCLGLWPVLALTRLTQIALTTGCVTSNFHLLLGAFTVGTSNHALILLIPATFDTPHYRHMANEN